LFHGLEGRASAIAGADQSAYACASDDVNRNARFAQNAKDADVRDAAGKASGEGYADTRATGTFRSAAIGEGAEDVLGGAQKILGIAAVSLASHNCSFYDARAVTKQLFDRGDSIL
jgi:hypothetical protein